MVEEVEVKSSSVVTETLVVVRPIKIVGLLCGVLAVVLLLLSAAATSWLKTEGVIEGLWTKCVYNLTEPDIVDCYSDSQRGTANISTTNWVTICQALCIISLIVCVVAIVVTSVGLRTSKFHIKYKLYWIGLIIFFAAVAFELISLVIFPIKFLNEMSASIEGHWSFGWAYIVGWAGAISEFAAGLFLLLDKGADELILRQKHVTGDNKPTAEEAEKAATEDAV